MVGSTCYTLRGVENLDKFEAKIDLQIFLGDSNNSHAYCVYNLRTLTFMESINVVIDDSRTTKLVEYENNDIFVIGALL